MLTDKDVSHFRVFGYVALRGLVAEEHVRRLQEAFDREIETNPRIKVDGPSGGKSLLPYTDTDDAFGELVDHPGLMEAMRDIDGTEFLYAGGSMNASMEDTTWHCDFNPPHHEGRPVKTMFYLDEMRAGSGAFYLIPGTNNPDLASSIFRAFGYYAESGGCRVDLDPHEVPGVAVETTPGDVVLWQNRMWHYAMKRSDGTPRRLLQNQYFMDPKEDAVEQKWLPEHLNARIGNGEHPFLYSKAMMKKGGPAREKMASRLEELGVTGVRE